MPYLSEVNRKVLEMGGLPNTPGELNYALTQLIIEYVKTKGKSYATYNDIVGALECCKLEFVRRVVNPHEDNAIKRNGDVYP